MAKTIKEIIIMLLVCLVAMLVLAIVLYKYIPSKKIVPEVSKYEASEQIQDQLEDNIDSKSEGEDKVLATYEVTKSDLSGYQKTNDYIPGKANPFADVSKTITEDINNTSNNNSNSTSSGNSSNNTEKEETPRVTPSNPSVYEDGGKK